MADPTIYGSTAIEVIQFVKSKRSKRTGLPIEIRFSSEDSFRSDLVDLLTLYSAVNKIGVNRVGIADTVGWSVIKPRIIPCVFLFPPALVACICTEFIVHAHVS